MNILFITTQFPFPLNNGGKIGAYNGISVLQKFSKVTVLSFCEDIDEIDNYKKLVEQFDNVTYMKPVYHRVHIRKNIFKLASALMSSFFRGIPYLVSKFYDKNMLKLIDEQIESNEYDIIFIDYLNMAVYGDYIKKKYGDRKYKYVLKDHNVEYELFEQEAKKSKFLKRWVASWQARLTRKYEIQHVKDADYVFTVCDDNVEKLQVFNENISAMKPTFEASEYRKELTKQNNVLYIGALSWKQNIDGLKWFFEKAWNKVVERIPDVTLKLVGSGGSTELFNEKNVEYLGYVESLDELYKESKVFIVPLLEGSGIRIKILEAFNNDIATVSTSVGCSTIGASSNEIFMTDDADEFAEFIIKLLEDDEFNNEMRWNAKEFLKKEYSLEQRQKQTYEILRAKLFMVSE